MADKQLKRHYKAIHSYIKILAYDKAWPTKFCFPDFT